jgi:hypothetical protein
MIDAGGEGEGMVKFDLSMKPSRLDPVGKKGTLFCVSALGKCELRLCGRGRAKDRQGTLGPEKQNPAGLLLVLEREKAGPVVDARR